LDVEHEVAFVSLNGQIALTVHRDVVVDDDRFRGADRWSARVAFERLRPAPCDRRLDPF
jgi:hypothetical protein